MSVIQSKHILRKKNSNYTPNDKLFHGARYDVTTLPKFHPVRMCVLSIQVLMEERNPALLTNKNFGGVTSSDSPTYICVDILRKKFPKEYEEVRLSCRINSSGVSRDKDNGNRQTFYGVCRKLYKQAKDGWYDYNDSDRFVVNKPNIYHQWASVEERQLAMKTFLPWMVV